MEQLCKALHNCSIAPQPPFKGVDLTKLDAPPEITNIIKNDQNLNTMIKEHKSALKGMQKYSQYIDEINPLASHADWIEKWLKYYNSKENAENIKIVEAQIKNRDTHLKLFELANQNSDAGKACRGLLAEKIRLKNLVDEHAIESEKCNNNFRDLHLEQKVKVGAKLNDKRNSGSISTSQVNEYQNEFDKLKEIENTDSSLDIYGKNKKLKK